MSCGSIYKIQFPNGKHYIGQTTTSLEQRTKEHKCCAKSGDTKCLYRALRKYEMVDTFELIEIDTADTLEELCEKEKKYITEYNSYYMNGKGYNMTYGGEGTNGYVFTEDVKQLMSKKRIQYFEDNSEAREKCSKAQKKRFENPQARKQHSEIKKKFFDENPNAGKEHSKRLKKYFEDKEYKILHTNWRFKRLEVDIIAYNGDTLHFIEVKTRLGKFAIPEENVHKKKIFHLIDAAEEFMILYPIWEKVQFDILSITVFENKKSFFLIEDIYL
jgi:putative endonuclease